MSRYRHLSIDERESILSMRAQGLSITQMAAALSRSPSTVSRELKRHPGDYSPHAAQEAYLARRPRRKPLLADQRLRDVVEMMLHLFLSPEQIENRLRLERAKTVSYATIYRALDKGLITPALRRHLRIKYKPYRRKRKDRSGQIPVDLWIDDRPEAVNNREEFGHWESDTIESKKGGVAMVTHVERKSRFTVAAFMPKKNAENYRVATIECLSGLPAGAVRSFTVDHGKEFARYRELQEHWGALVYFAHTGCPWERGTNENTNGLLRQWFPRRKDLASFSDQELLEALALLNHRPRKCLGWKTPYEVFFHTSLHFT